MRGGAEDGLADLAERLGDDAEHLAAWGQFWYWWLSPEEVARLDNDRLAGVTA